MFDNIIIRGNRSVWFFLFAILEVPRIVKCIRILPYDSLAELFLLSLYILPAIGETTISRKLLFNDVSLTFMHAQNRARLL